MSRGKCLTPGPFTVFLQTRAFTEKDAKVGVPVGLIVLGLTFLKAVLSR